MQLRRKVNLDARACCVIADEIWAAKLQGGVCILNAHGDILVPTLSIPIDGVANAQVAHLAAVFDEVWMATTDGQLVFARAEDRTVHVVPLRLSGEGQTSRLTGMCFNGHVVVVGSENSTVFVLHPLTKRVLHTLPMVSPCTTVAQFYSFIVAGDRGGAVLVWDALDGHLVVCHTRSKSRVACVLHEHATGTLWVSRENGNLDVYRLDAERHGLCLVHRVADVGKIMSMSNVTGMIVATSADHEVLLIDAASGKLLSRDKAAHQSFITLACRTRCRETADVWTLGPTDGVCVWCIEGRSVSAYKPPFLHPREQARLISSTLDSTSLDIAECGTAAQSDRGLLVRSQEEFRKAKEEAQELRLRLFKLEESLHVKDAQGLQRDSTVQELECARAKLTKDLTDLSSNLAAVERERAILQGELSTAKEDASKARSHTSTLQTEKLKLAQEASQLRTDKSNLEQRLRDSESRIADLQAENKRLCASIGDVTIAQKAEHDVQQRILQGSAKVSEDLDRIRKLNSILSAALASTVYTIRRKEEEDRDLTVLLNAFRRKVADHIADPYLSSLLLVTMVRNPQRFDLDCDEYTRSQLMDRHGPFIQFLQQLQVADADAYDKVIQYLQNCGDRGSIPLEARECFDRMIAQALRGDDISTDLIGALKRSMPNMVGTAVDGAVTGLDLVPPPDAADAKTPSTTGTGTGVGATNTADSASTRGPTAISSSQAGGTTSAATDSGVAVSGKNATTTANTAASVGGGSADVVAYLRSLDAEKAGCDTVTASLLREIRSERTIEGNYGKEQQLMFEFVLKTRRTLVECLALLQRRTISAQQVLEALSLNAGAGVANSASATTASPNSSASATGSVAATGPISLDKIVAGIMSELVELTSTIVSRFLTAAEKRRLSVS